MQRREFVGGAVAASGFSGLSFAGPRREDLSALRARLEACAALAPGTLCVAIKDVASGNVIGVNETILCPMFSTVKLFVGAWVEGEIAAGRISRTQSVKLDAASLPTGSGTLETRLRALGTMTASVNELVAAMLLESDNAATDALIGLAGAPSRISADLDLTGQINFSRTTQDYGGAADACKTMEDYRAWLADTRNCATPMAFLRALERLDRGTLTGRVGDSATLAWMSQCKLGQNRVTKGLMPDWSCAVRTGTGSTVVERCFGVNQIVIAQHKTTGRKLLIVAFQKDIVANAAVREASLASVGRAISGQWPQG